MKRMTKALFELTRSIVTKPLKPANQAVGILHWTMFDKSIDEMSDLERRVAVERLEDEMLRVIEKKKNTSN